jgi:hypothetical protein
LHCLDYLHIIYIFFCKTIKLIEFHKFIMSRQLNAPCIRLRREVEASRTPSVHSVVHAVHEQRIGIVIEWSSRSFNEVNEVEFRASSSSRPFSELVQNLLWGE